MLPTSTYRRLSSRRSSDRIDLSHRLPSPNDQYSRSSPPCSCKCQLLLSNEYGKGEGLSSALAADVGFFGRARRSSSGLDLWKSAIALMSNHGNGKDLALLSVSTALPVVLALVVSGSVEVSDPSHVETGKGKDLALLGCSAMLPPWSSSCSVSSRSCKSQQLLSARIGKKGKT